MNTEDKYRVLFYGMCVCSFQNFTDAREFVHNARGDGFMVTLWELVGSSSLRYVEVPDVR